MIEFDPNNQRGPKAPVYATYIPSRSPQFKTHTKMTHARNAIGFRADYLYSRAGNPGIVYEFADGGWTEVDRYDPPVDCAHCGRDFQEVKLELTAEKKLAAENAGKWKNTHVSFCYRIPCKGVLVYKQHIVCARCYQDYFGYGAKTKLTYGDIGVKQDA